MTTKTVNRGIVLELEEMLQEEKSQNKREEGQPRKKM